MTTAQCQISLNYFQMQTYLSIKPKSQNKNLKISIKDGSCMVYLDCNKPYYFHCMCELHIIGQIVGASEFKESNLFCKWGLHAGGNWKVIAGLKEGQTQIDSPLDGKICYWCHPVDVHYATKGIQGWPKFYFQVWHQDEYGRDQFCSYGFCHIPTSSGYHKYQCVTWKPRSSVCDRFYEYFLGGGLQLKSPENIYHGLDRFRLQTVAMGTLHLELNVISRNFNKYGIVTN